MEFITDESLKQKMIDKGKCSTLVCRPGAYSALS